MKGNERSRGAHLANPRLSRGFNLLWFGQAVSQLGDYIAYLTIPLFIQTLVDSTVQFGIAYALETFPTLLFGFFGGVLIDRVRRRSVMITADVVRAGAFFFLAYVAGRPDAGIAVVYVISFLVGTFATAFSNAMYAFIPSLVDGSQLAAANSRIAASQQVATAMGPLLAGAMAQSLGAGPGFFLNGATFLVSAASILFIGSSVEAAPAPRRNIFTEAKEGLAFLWNEARLRWSTIAAAVANFVVGFIESTLVVLATVVLGTQTEGQIGFLFSLMGVGGIAGALIAPRISAIFGLGRAMTIGFFIKGLSLLLLVNSRFGLAAFVAMFTWFVGLSVLNVPIHTMRQTYTPPELLGRVITGARAIGWGTLPIGALLGTFAADQTDYARLAKISPWIVLAMATLLLFTPLWSAESSRRPRPPGGSAEVIHTLDALDVLDAD